MDFATDVAQHFDGTNGMDIPDEPETQATQQGNQTDSQSQEDREIHLFGSLHPCNPAQSRYDLWKTKPLTTIGRRQDNDIILVGGKVSNLHAEIHWDGKLDASSNVMIKDRNSTNGTFINGHRIQKGQYRILKQGNEISFGSRSSEPDEADYRFIFYHLAGGLPKSGVYAKYDLGTELGRGSFAIVYRAISKATGKWCAVKIIQESRRTGRDDGEGGSGGNGNVQLQREIAIMGQLKHPNICELKEVFVEDNNEIQLVIELIEGGDLLEHILQNRISSEEDARHITYQLCDALAYIHEKGVAHRDLKPENVLLTSDVPPRVKVADFGLAKVSDSMTMLRTMCGTPAYLAPEVVKQQTDEDTTTESTVGVLTGASPFVEDENQKDIRTRIAERTVDWRVLDEAPIPISRDCRSFIEQLLRESPTERMSMSAALQHSWFNDYTQQQPHGTPSQASQITGSSQVSVQPDFSMAAPSSNNIDTNGTDGEGQFSQGFKDLNIAGSMSEESGDGPATANGNGKGRADADAGEDVADEGDDMVADPPTPPSQVPPGLRTLQKEGSRVLQRRRDVLEQAQEGGSTLPEPSVEMISNFSAQEQKRRRNQPGPSNSDGKKLGKRAHAELSDVVEEGQEGDVEMQQPGPSQPKRGRKPKSTTNSAEETPVANGAGLRRSTRNSGKGRS